MSENPGIRLARMRTRDKALVMLKQDDPETSLTRNGLDRLISSGMLPHVKIGAKVLINYDTLLELLSNGLEAIQPPPTPQQGVIRPVKI